MHSSAVLSWREICKGKRSRTEFAEVRTRSISSIETKQIMDTFRKSGESMQELETYFLIEILKHFIHREKISSLPDISLEKLFEISEKHNVTGIVFYMIAPLLEEQKQTSIYQRFSERNIITVYNSVMKEKEVELFAEKLEQAHITYAFFKGLEIRALYPVPDLRTMGDADILVREEDMKAVAEILNSLGYDKSDGGSNVWTFKKGIMSYEIHSRLVAQTYWNDVDYETYFTGIFDKLIPAEKGYRRHVSLEDHFIFLCFHLAKHLDGSGAGIRMFMDIALYLMKYQNDMNWEYIWEECTDIKLARFVEILISVCSDWFDVDSSFQMEKIEQTTLEQLKEYVMSGGVFGFERDESFRRLRKGMKGKDSGSSLLIKMRTLWKIAFPDRKHMAYFLPQVLYHPTLLPLAWCKRWKMGLENQWKMKAAVHGMGKNMEEAKAQYSLLKRIGL